MFAEIVIVVLLTILNGVLAMSELAVVSARPARLRVLAEAGHRGSAVAIRLAENPGRFLSTVQIGITLVGVLSGAFSGATLGARLTQWLLLQGMSEALASTLGVGCVVVGITYLSLIVGELVPKQIALRNPEMVASRMAGAMLILSKVSLPLVWLLDGSGRAVLSLLGQKGASSGTVTDEEIKTVLAEAQSAGVIESEESQMISGVMRLADRTARGLMTPRRDVELISVDDTIEEIRQALRESQHSRLPVRNGNSDEIVGVMLVKNFYDALANCGTVDIRSIISDVPIVSDLAGAIDIIQSIRKTVLHMVLVYDEYGHFEGIITSGDILEAITGAYQEEGEEEPALLMREDGSYLVAGWTPIDEFIEHIRVPVDDDPDFTTVAGYVLDELKRIPALGESFVKNGWKFEVVDLDGRRIDKLLVSPVLADDPD
ncbi:MULTISPECIES: hemolysin family protein [Rhizobium/Agrobacterium group]|uniref:hemolysin family protein n=1 Tax=Rhizobium/Agrobacterium group TaxID=227290 RepID=UPI000B3FB144|nr:MULTISPECIES: hemolysin family protein [Rhizobium/Agrobacterium group]MCF1481710.1 HlyC/CorC family transporter [Allorhizobium ampelinum]NSZ42518.1 HlyC/CorC family transporter [Agrobacterium vitis]NTA26226.1 HlyC/CorC family transporter [Allorhizobium ampelinum]OVE95533.1 DNA-binding protein [Allorhizobium ampelinum]